MVSLRLIWFSLIQRKSLYLTWILSLSLAVTGLIVIDVYRRSLTRTLETQGRNILSADLALSARRTLSDEEFRKFRDIFPPDQVSGFAQVNELFAMVSAHEHDTRLAMIRFISDAYPLLGELKIESEGHLRELHGRDFDDKPTAWIAPDLLTLLNLREGELLRVGNVEFKIVGLIRQDSSQTFRMGNMAPRVYLHHRYLQKTALVQFGSTFSEIHFVSLQAPRSAAKSDVLAAFPEADFNVTTPLDLEQGSFRALSNVMDYLGLIGLVTLALGWIGVYYLGRRWLSFEVTASGILKTLGVTSGEVRAQLLIKLLLVLLAGITIGGGLSWMLAQALVLPLKDSLPAEFALAWSWKSTALLILVGPLSGLLLLFNPINRIATAKPSFLLGGSHTNRKSIWPLLFIGLISTLLFVVLTLMQARSWLVTGAFLASLLVTLVLVAGLSYLILLIVGRKRDQWPPWNIHLASAIWTRRATSTILLVTVGTLASLLAQLIPHVERTLVGELNAPAQMERPALFLFDIQDEQLEPLRDLLQKNDLVIEQSSPFIRARILSVNDQAFERGEVSNWSTREQEVEARFRNRGVNLSYRETLSPSESIVSGKPWNEHKAEPAMISVEERYAERLKLRLGDRLRFDIQGVEVEAQIGSLRRVNWNSFQPNFFIQFPPGILEAAPKTWIATIKRHKTLTPPQIQLLIGRKFANVTSINVDETLTTLTDLITKLSQGLNLASRLALTLGLFVFIMILTFQLISTQRDWMHLRVQGLTRHQVVGLQILTYGTLGFVGSLFGAAMSSAVAWAIARYGFSTPVRWNWQGSITVLLGTWVLMVCLIPWLSSRQGQSLETLGIDNPNE